MTKDNEPSFEDGLKRLEEIVEKLSSEEISLDESFGLYEEGTRLVNDCSSILKEFEGKLKTLSSGKETDFNVD
ncbi:MAG: exodeoxyribonuclease VII small subunit [candidate division Zixibacteria bacterium]|nr:exodeoxyribonuclease VII small subunit [candidate division Zixibacteria bacterium]